jgi:hypothetical protein
MVGRTGPKSSYQLIFNYWIWIRGESQNRAKSRGKQSKEIINIWNYKQKILLGEKSREGGRLEFGGRQFYRWHFNDAKVNGTKF